MTTSLTRRLLDGMLAVLLVSGGAGAQTPPVRPRAPTVSTDTPAIAALRVKANAGDAGAQFQLGSLYSFGRGVPRDEAQGVTWYRKSAEQGYSDAWHSLGLMYSMGWGVKQDYVSAYMWFYLPSVVRNTNFDKGLFDGLAKTMTSTQIQAAKKLAMEWQEAFRKRERSIAR